MRCSSSPSATAAAATCSRARCAEHQANVRAYLQNYRAAQSGSADDAADAMTLQTHARFITLEGGEGAGKSTVLAALREVLQAHAAAKS